MPRWTALALVALAAACGGSGEPPPPPTTELADLSVVRSFGCSPDAYRTARERAAENGEWEGWVPELGGSVCELFARRGLPDRVRHPRFVGFAELAYLDYVTPDGAVATVGVQRRQPLDPDVPPWQINVVRGFGDVPLF